MNGIETNTAALHVPKSEIDLPLLPSRSASANNFQTASIGLSAKEHYLNRLDEIAKGLDEAFLTTETEEGIQASLIQFLNAKKIGISSFVESVGAAVMGESRIFEWSTNPEENLRTIPTKMLDEYQKYIEELLGLQTAAEAFFDCSPDKLLSLLEKEYATTADAHLDLQHIDYDLAQVLRSQSALKYGLMHNSTTLTGQKLRSLAKIVRQNMRAEQWVKYSKTLDMYSELNEPKKEIITELETAIVWGDVFKVAAIIFANRDSTATLHELSKNCLRCFEEFDTKVIVQFDEQKDVFLLKWYTRRVLLDGRPVIKPIDIFFYGNGMPPVCQSSASVEAAKLFSLLYDKGRFLSLLVEFIK